MYRVRVRETRARAGRLDREGGRVREGGCPLARSVIIISSSIDYY